MSSSTSPSTSPLSSPTLASTLTVVHPNSPIVVSAAVQPSSPSPTSSLRSVVALGQTLGHALSSGDSNILSLLHTLAEKGKTRHEDRKKRKRAKKEKKEQANNSSKSATWSATSILDAKANAEPAASAKKTPPKRKRSVSDARMFTSDDTHTVHRDRSRSAPLCADVRASPTMLGTPRPKDVPVRSHSHGSSLTRDPPTLSAGKPKKTNSAGSLPTVHLSSSSVPIKKSPRMRGRSSSVCGSSASAPIRRAAPTTATSPTPKQSMAALLSPRSERVAPPTTTDGFCAHGRPHHHQSRTSLVATGHHHTCRHARSVPVSVEMDAVPTLIAVSPPSATGLDGSTTGGGNHWSMGDAELESILSGIEESAAAANSSATTTPFLTASLSNSTSTSPVSLTSAHVERRTSLDIMHIADTMERVSIDSKESDEFDPMRFLDVELATATAAVAAAAQQHPLIAPSPVYPAQQQQHSARQPPPFGYAPPPPHYAIHQHHQQQPRPHFTPQQLTRSMSHPHSFHTPGAMVSPTINESSSAFGSMPARCNSSDLGFFSSLMAGNPDEQQMRELLLAIDGAATSIPDLGYYDATN